MAHDDRITRLTRTAQRDIFRLAEFDHDLTLKAISFSAGIPYSTLRTYASGEAVMPVTAVLRLVDVVPDQLLSRLFDPVDREIVKDDDNDSCLDDLGNEAGELEAEVRRSRHPQSPGGVDIVPIEEARIRRKALRLRRKVA
jgi:hypothetical protein